MNTEKIYSHTKALCSVCKAVVDAHIVESEHKIYLKKDADFVAIIGHVDLAIDYQNSSLLQEQVLIHKKQKHNLKK